MKSVPAARKALKTIYPYANTRLHNDDVGHGKHYRVWSNHSAGADLLAIGKSMEIVLNDALKNARARQAAGEEDNLATPFSLPEINAWFNEADYLRLSQLVGHAATLAGDGGGHDLGVNAEYERGMAELILYSMGLSSDHLDEVVRAIHQIARDNAGIL